MMPTAGTELLDSLWSIAAIFWESVETNPSKDPGSDAEALSLAVGLGMHFSLCKLEKDTCSLMESCGQ